MSRGWVYLIRADNGLYKIGMTKRQGGKRIRALKFSNACALELVRYVPSRDASYLEAVLHRHFAAKRHHGEWFVLSEDDVRRLPELCKEIEQAEITTRANLEVW